MYNIVEVDGFIRSCIDVHNKANKYGIPKEFKTKKDAEKWIERHTYKGMSFRYEIKKADQ